MVTVMRGGEEVKISKRAGSYVTVRDLIDEVGRDAVRYFFLMRKGDSQLVFDVDLARAQSEENPVYYIQMAHARCAGIFRVGEIDAATVTGIDVDLSVLDAARGAGADQGAARLSRRWSPARPTRSSRIASRRTCTTPPARSTSWYHKAHVLERAGADHARAAGARARRRRSCCGTGCDLAWASPRRSACRLPFPLRTHRPTSSHPDNDRSRRRLRRARLRRNAVRQSRRRARRLGDVLLRVGEPPRAGAARRRRRQRLSGRQAEERLRSAASTSSGLEQADGESFRWRGRYRHDLNSAETLETHLGVFSHFSPKIPEQFRKAPFVFLGNIDPRLQLDVLTQVEKPKLVACDTMNFWIESRRPDLLELLEHVDLITLNDAEARQLTEEFNLVKAARWIMARGPKLVIIKKGEHGAFMFTRDVGVLRAGVSARGGVRSDRRRRLVRRRLHGLPRAQPATSPMRTLRRAVVYGSAMGSFAVEKFSIERLLEITPADDPTSASPSSSSLDQLRAGDAE